MIRTKKFASDEAERVNIRLPTGMKARLKASADANERDVTKEVVHALNQYLAQAGVQEPREKYIITDAELCKAVLALSPNKRQALLELLSDV